MFRDPRHLLQLLRRRVKNRRKRTELFQQRMGQRVRITPGNRIEQQQFQAVDVREAVQPCLQKLPLQPLTVSRMNIAFLFHALSFTARPAGISRYSWPDAARFPPAYPPRR